MLSNKYSLLLSERDGIAEKYDTDIELLKNQMRDMQQLLNNPEKFSLAAKLEIPQYQ